MLVNAPGAPSRVSGWPWTEVGQLVVKAESLLWAGDRTSALAVLENALSLDATAVERYTVGTTLLRASNCVRGWDLYDLRPSRPVDRLPGVTRWRGEPCRLLVIVTEQGFGDAIQFLRFIPHVTHRADSVVVAVHDELLDVVATSPLLRDLEVIPKSLARRMAWPTDARWERLMSLPARIPNFRVDAAGSYLRVSSVGEKPTLHPSAMGVITVGVAWRSTYRRGFPNRSIPARLMSRLTESDRITGVSLHRNKDICALPRGVGTVQIRNFVETAQVISQCDWVVTADTVTANLAPALGVPTIVCLLHTPDWRWGAPPIPTRWYAWAETIFQDASGDWSTVLKEAAHRILDRSARSSPAGRVGEGQT